MRVIGVVDVRGGRAVHARAGAREHYAPIGDAVDLARTYVDQHGLSELYVADLDAIQAETDVGRPFQGRHGGAESPAPHPVERIAALGAPVWLDAGVSSVDRARESLAMGAAHAVVGLETLSSFEMLHEICDAIGGKRVAFSLDLRSGNPVGISEGDTAAVVAARAAAAGVDAIIVLDLARVGMKSGIDLALVARVRKAAPAVTLLAGGGVRGAGDLARLADAGGDGALVATAILDGSLTSWRP